MKVEGICVIITGGAKGIGKAVTQRLLERGAKFVAILDFDRASGEETVSKFAEQFGEERVRFLPCDVSKDYELKESFQTAYDVHKHIDVVINNAGVAGHPKTLQINLGAVISGSYLAKKYLSKQHDGDGGLIINVASIAGLFPWQDAVYSATKYGVVGFTLSLPLEDPVFCIDDVRVCTICPGGVDTAIWSIDTSIIRFLEIGQVVDAFVMAIEDNTKHACCIRITAGKGIDEHPIKAMSEVEEELQLFKDP